MSTTVTVFLEPYDGQAHTASAFMDKAEFAAKNTFTGLPNGALSFMYDNATYVERTQTEPTILEPLGPLPVRLNNEAQATFAARKEDWKDNREMHNECDKGVNAFRTAFVAALPAHILHKVLDGSDLRTITLRELITNFKTKVINKREALAAHQLQLDKPFIAGDSITTHCFIHITAHRAFKEFNEELSPLARYNLLAKSLEPCGLFTIVRDQLTIKPVPEQTFEALEARSPRPRHLRWEPIRLFRRRHRSHCRPVHHQVPPQLHLVNARCAVHDSRHQGLLLGYADG